MQNFLKKPDETRHGKTYRGRMKKLSEKSHVFLADFASQCKKSRTARLST